MSWNDVTNMPYKKLIALYEAAVKLNEQQKKYIDGKTGTNNRFKN